MELITSGEKAVTTIDNRLEAASSQPINLAKDSSNAGPITSETKRSKRSGGTAWTPSVARQILMQTVRECQLAGLPVKLYNSKRGSVVCEVLAHQIQGDDLVPTDVPTKPT